LPDIHQPFETLLGWLDRDRDVAGEKYETIRSGLVRIFVSKGFSDAEHLADETIDRVIKRLPDIIDTYEGPPVRYFHGVARDVLLEASRPREIAVELPAIPVVTGSSLMHRGCVCVRHKTGPASCLVLVRRTHGYAFVGFKCSL